MSRLAACRVVVPGPRPSTLVHAPSMTLTHHVLQGSRPEACPEINSSSGGPSYEFSQEFVMRVILGCALVASLVSGVAADDEKIDTKKLIGKWEPKEENSKGKVMIEFSKDGKLTVTFSGKEDKIEGTYKVEG